MNGHPQPEELDLLALGALDLDERAPLEAHLRTCADCRRALEAARGRLALLALTAPAATPSPRVKQQLLGRIRPTAATAPVSAFRAWLQQASLTFALASLVLFLSTVWLGLVNRDLHRSNEEMRARIRALHETAERERLETARARAVVELLTAPDTLRITLVSGPARPVPEGRAFYHPRKGLLFTAAHLPALAPGKTYQLWLLPPEGAPVSAGVFATDEHGNGSVVLPPLPAGVVAKGFAVSVEPAGGVPQPTGPIVLAGTTG